MFRGLVEENVLKFSLNCATIILVRVSILNYWKNMFFKSFVNALISKIFIFYDLFIQLGNFFPFHK